MTFEIAIVVFIASLSVSLLSSVVLAKSLEKLGSRLHLTEGLLGVLTALAADSPEISSSVAALIAGHHDLGVGVVLGSNIFNLAMLLGLSAIVAGAVKVAQPVLLFNGVVAVTVMVITSALIFKIISPGISIILILIVLVPYLWMSSVRSKTVSRLRLPTNLKNMLGSLIEAVHSSTRKDNISPDATWIDVLAILSALFFTVLASYGLVQSTVAIGQFWNIPHVVLGTLVLAALTGIPNILAAIRLAKQNRGSAVISEALNSNTINVIAGICAPALFFGLNIVSQQTYFVVWCLIAMTVFTIGLAYRRKGLYRGEGVIIMVLYILFAMFIIAQS